jgi:hypothetical protein
MLQFKHQKLIPPERLVKINANSIVIYTERKNHLGRLKYSENNGTEETTSTFDTVKEKRKNLHNGFLSDRASSRLRTYIKYLLWCSGCFKTQGKHMFLRMNGKISFLTLTLCAPQMHDDNYIKSQMLNQFITEISKRYIGIRYIWRAEKQRNGNIHFHFLINKYVDWNFARVVWNRLLLKEGYLQLYTLKFTGISFSDYCQTIGNYSIDKISTYRQAWNKGNECGWTNPPSSWIESLKNSGKAMYYITKYISKREKLVNDQDDVEREKMKIKGHLWFCCQEILLLNGSTENMDYEVQRDLIKLRKLAPESFYNDNFITVIKLTIEEIFNLGCYHLYNCFISSFSVLSKNELFTP